MFKNAGNEGILSSCMGFPLAHDSERWVSFQVGSALLTLRPRGPGLAWGDGPIPPGSAAVQLAFGRQAPTAQIRAIVSAYTGLPSIFAAPRPDRTDAPGESVEDWSTESSASITE